MRPLWLQPWCSELLQTVRPSGIFCQNIQASVTLYILMDHPDACTNRRECYHSMFCWVINFLTLTVVKFLNLIFSGLIFHSVLEVEFICLVLTNCFPEKGYGPLWKDLKWILYLLDELHSYETATILGAQKHVTQWRTLRWGDTKTNHLITITSCLPNEWANIDVSALHKHWMGPDHPQENNLHYTCTIYELFGTGLS